MEPSGPVLEEAGLELDPGATLGQAFKRADKALGLRRGLFKSCLKSRRNITILLNGDRLEGKGMAKRILEPGDEIILLSGLAGG